MPAKKKTDPAKTESGIKAEKPVKKAEKPSTSVSPPTRTETENADKKVEKSSKKSIPASAGAKPVKKTAEKLPKAVSPLTSAKPVEKIAEKLPKAVSSLTSAKPVEETAEKLPDDVSLLTDDKPEKKTAASRINKTPKALRYEDIHFVDSTRSVWNYSLFTEEVINNFQNGTLYNAYNYFGSQPATILNKDGYYFAVWAPNATAVSVIGDFNGWQPNSHPLMVRLDKSGIWEGFIPGFSQFGKYKYHIHGFMGSQIDKGDPYARYWERRPNTASVTFATNYQWKDEGWMQKRKAHNSLQAPWTVYEVHLTSWMRPDKNNEETYNTYAQIEEKLVPYVKDMGFTHVEFMPVMEHPYDGSWGYQGTGYFAPSSRFGTPDEFKQLVDAFHKEDIGVILDWVPSHFPYDSHGLFMFDGTHTYEYADMRKGYHPDWNSYIFNYKRNEVRSFLISSARFWFEQYHADGIRVDAVSSMLKLDYSRNEGEWEPNEFGGNGNLEAISLIKELNETVFRDFPDVQMIAEESTDWPGVSRPTFADGLGFGMKWMMGWMHDTLAYFKTNPYDRQFVQDKLSFSMAYYYDENFMLPLSHDEVVHGKSPMLYKMPGDDWQKFANLRLLYTYMFTHPGGKLLFMGNEFGATNEWNHKSELQWDLLQYVSHSGLKDCVKDLLHLVKAEPAIFENQFNIYGFEWIELNRREECIIAYRRKGHKPEDDLLVIFNMRPDPVHDASIYATGKKDWKEIFNSDSKKYWGNGHVYNPDIQTNLVNKKTSEYEIKLHLPPLGALILK